MQREFTSTYEQAIRLIKQIKINNDTLNRIIGVEPGHSVACRIQKQQSYMDETMGKIDGLIQKLQQSYLDPDTARKIGTAKQQFRIQRDRRKQLLITSNYQQELREVNKKNQKQHKTTHTYPTPFSVIPSQGSNESSTWNRFTHKDTDSTYRSENHSSVMQHEEQVHIDLDLQSKLMQQRQKDIMIISDNLMNVHSIMNQTNMMTHQQGEQLDIIGEEMFDAYKHLKGAREELSEANEEQKKAKRKYVVLSFVVLLGLAIAAIMLLM